MSKLFLIGAGFFISLFWSIAKTLCNRQTQEAILVIKGKPDKELLKYMHQSQIEKMYGGTCENVGESGILFPPSVKSNNYLLDTDIKSEILVSEDVYIKMVESDARIVRSPYVFLNSQITRGRKIK